MKIILRQDVEKLGEAGEIVDVKPGYFRNYLHPRDMAMRATDSNRKVYEEERRMQQVRENKAKFEAQKVADKLENVSLNAPVQVGEEDKVFGSVTSQDIAKLLDEQGFDIDKKDILLDEPIKALGIYNVPVKLHKDITGEVKVWVIKE
ncbi:MAG: 50S ribosomal protein L9 [Candidatus Marinimicrobia bacterium]|nr:50S ribosomal protein L9 [Candidatus Neomarinimicrobiota bacterium]MCF7829044.1 50S ribosomal protein L9 [Candidatus Neomarinimicrobiota bacterium]MCF7881819.1 50S ribosomal protein L9 [Candidatus Neomarinimicrobiota bacterium]